MSENNLLIAIVRIWDTLDTNPSRAHLLALLQEIAFKAKEILNEKKERLELK